MMKKIRAILLILSLLVFYRCDYVPDVIEGEGPPLSEEEVAAALKEALRISSDSVTNWLNKVDAYYKDLTIKILFPEQALEVKQALENNGFGFLVSDLELKMNRAAEDAAIKAKPIFFSAIDSMTIADAIAILEGHDSSATMYLKSKTEVDLYKAFYPEIKASLEKVGAQQTWNDVISTYNRLTGRNVNTDLADYTTQKALRGLFIKIAQEEKAIRKDPAKRVTDLLKKVFGSLDG